MSSGRTHDRITLWSLPWVVLLTLFLTKDGTIGLIVAGAFLFSGLMFGPDLDIYSIQFKRWGWFRWIWIPYQKALRHRSLWSHGFIVGTVIRSLYLLIILTLTAMMVISLAQLIWGFSWNWQEFAQKITVSENRQPAIALFSGLELGAMSHSLSDWISSYYKRWQKQKNNRNRKSRKSKS